MKNGLDVYGPCKNITPSVSNDTSCLSLMVLNFLKTQSHDPTKGCSAAGTQILEPTYFRYGPGGERFKLPLRARQPTDVTDLITQGLDWVMSQCVTVELRSQHYTDPIPSPSITNPTSQQFSAKWIKLQSTKYLLIFWKFAYNNASESKSATRSTKRLKG